MRKPSYCIAEQDFTIQCNDASALELINSLLRGFHTLAPSPRSICYHIEGQGPFEVRTEGTLRFRSLGIDDLVPRLEWTMVRDALSRSPHVAIHAAALSFEGAALLLPGRSGAGKTTLALGLLTVGATLLSDEIALLSGTEPSIVPFPRVICAKANTLSVIDDLGSETEMPTVCKRLNGVTCLAPSQPPNITAASVTVIYPEYRPGVRSFSPITRAEGLARLLEHTLNPGPRSFLALSELAERSTFYSLKSDDLRWSIEQTVPVTDTVAA